MSQKITGKNLHYDQSLPPFLARLKGQHDTAARDGGPDPILAARARPKGKPRSASEEAEDAPVIVDDEGNVVDGARVGADGTVTRDQREDQAENPGADHDEGKGEEKDDEEKVAGIGASKKRKVGRVVGADADGEGEGDDDVKGGGVSSAKRRAGPVTARDGQTDSKKDSSEKSATTSKAKKKTKKIKLSFGDDGD